MAVSAYGSKCLRQCVPGAVCAWGSMFGGAVSAWGNVCLGQCVPGAVSAWNSECLGQ